MNQITMLLNNPYRPDPRVQREASTLVEAGYDVDLYCWDRQSEFPGEEIRDGISIHRCQEVASTYAAGWRQLWRLPRFWKWAQKQVAQRTPQVVHCHDLDTLYPGVALKRQLGCKLVYDAHEHYPALMSLYLPSGLVHLLELWEHLLIRRADHIVCASQTLAEVYRRRTNLPVTVIGNAPPLSESDRVQPRDTQRIRHQLGLNADQLGVFYIGGFTNNRAILPLIAALEGSTTWQAHLWGDGPQRPAVEAAVASLNNVHYHGWAQAGELPGLFAAANVIYYCLRDDYPGAPYNAPNTLAYAMAAGRPLIATPSGDLGAIVAETECGILLHEISPGTIRQALLDLEDPLSRQRLGENGRRSAENHYNWETISQHLLKLYASLGN